MQREFRSRDLQAVLVLHYNKSCYDGLSGHRELCFLSSAMTTPAGPNSCTSTLARCTPVFISAACHLPSNPSVFPVPEYVVPSNSIECRSLAFFAFRLSGSMAKLSWGRQREENNPRVSYVVHRHRRKRKDWIYGSMAAQPTARRLPIFYIDPQFRTYVIYGEKLFNCLKQSAASQNVLLFNVERRWFFKLN